MDDRDTIAGLLNMVRTVCLMCTCIAAAVLLTWRFMPSRVDQFDRWIISAYTGKYESKLTAAEQMIIEGDAAGGIKKLNNLLRSLEPVRKKDRLDPVKRRCFSAVIRALENTGNPDKAIYWYGKWVEFDERDLTARIRQAELMLKVPEYAEKGEKLLEDLHRRCPFEMIVYPYALMKSRKGAHGIAEAFAAYDSLLRRDRSRWQIYWDTGNGFNEEQSAMVFPSYHPGGVCRFKATLPPSVRRYRIDPPAGSYTGIINPSLSIKKQQDMDLYHIADLAVQTHQMEMKENGDIFALITSGGNDPYFMFSIKTDNIIDSNDNTTFQAYLLPALLLFQQLNAKDVINDVAEQLTVTDGPETADAFYRALETWRKLSMKS